MYTIFYNYKIFIKGKFDLVSKSFLDKLRLDKDYKITETWKRR